MVWTGGFATGAVMQDSAGRAALENDRWIRLEAIQIVAQLPDDTRQALAVLAQARKLVVGYMDSGELTEAPKVTLLRP